MERPAQDDNTQPEGKRPYARRSGPNGWLLIGLLIILGLLFFANPSKKTSYIDDYYFFLQQVEDGNVRSIAMHGVETASGEFKNPPIEPEFDSDGKPKTDRKNLEKHFSVRLLQTKAAQDELTELLRAKGVETSSKRPQAENAIYVFWGIAILLSVGMFVFVFVSMRRTREQMMGGGFLSGFSKSPAKRYEASQQSVLFKDVAGLTAVKQDLQEIVEYLKDPKKFQRLGGRVPKGCLLMGPPGTGKTLLARAVAGEADVPFYSVNGSEFIQMFVGVGASRVRDLFSNAKENSPGIIFIDEIDAVGRQRGAGLGGGHDEREQTLNQILSEMDGFSQTDSVIVLAATNRPDVLDPALLRPGRFDRHVTVGRPTHKGRVEIFKVHVRDVPLSDDVDLEVMASATIGLTGADIRNLVNEAALWAARHDKNKVEMEDFDYARDKVLMGAKREEVLSEVEKEKTAYHEAGHTLMAWFLPGADRVHKVTIIPRGQALGATQMMPTEDRLSISEGELHDHLVVLLGGRAAEKLIYDEVTAGAENDLERATGMARRMVTSWGMSQRLGPVSYKLSDEDPFLGREIHQQRQFSEHTMELIDEEVTTILHAAAARATELLDQHRAKLDALAKGLLEDEELDEHEIAGIIGPSVHAESNGKASPKANQTAAASS
ncbi:MAG: cell division protein FtsH [Planctomycetaceae bacterium]|nr:cell division protein FtsH [Planctomycetaceae bacterium]